MKKAGLIVNRNKDRNLLAAGGVVRELNNTGIDVCFFDRELMGISGPGSHYLSRKEFLKEIEAIFCLGGDGTLLNVAGSFHKYGIPLMGINIGHLGFLTEVDVNELSEKAALLASGDYVTEERIMLEVSLKLKKRTIKKCCLNDFVVSRGSSPRLIDIKAYINEDFVDSFTGDGVIVSTPTGSTAYSLSSGGPIAGPSMKLMMITPICPHNIYSRTFLVDTSKTVIIKVGEREGPNGLVTFDGQKSYQISGLVSAEIRNSSDTLKLIRINGKNFYDVLRMKLYNRSV